MKYVKFWGETMFCGTSYEDYMKFDDDVSEALINEQCEDLSHDNAESYSYLVNGWDEELSDEELQDFIDDAAENAGWEYISKEEYKQAVGEE